MGVSAFFQLFGKLNSNKSQGHQLTRKPVVHDQPA